MASGACLLSLHEFSWLQRLRNSKDILWGTWEWIAAGRTAIEWSVFNSHVYPSDYVVGWGGGIPLEVHPQDKETQGKHSWQVRGTEDYIKDQALNIILSFHHGNPFLTLQWQLIPGYKGRIIGCQLGDRDSHPDLRLSFSEPVGWNGLERHHFLLNAGS